MSVKIPGLTNDQIMTYGQVDMSVGRRNIVHEKLPIDHLITPWWVQMWQKIKGTSPNKVYRLRISTNVLIDLLRERAGESNSLAKEADINTAIDNLEKLLK